MLGIGWDSGASMLASTAIGPGWDSSAESIPALSLGPGWDALSDLMPDLGMRGPQIEPADLQLDRLSSIVSSALARTTVNLATTNVTPLYTATQKTYILGVILRITNADSVTVSAQASLGVNPSTDNLFANQTLVNLDAEDELYVFWNNLNTGVILNTTDQLDISVTSAVAAALTATAYVIGVFVS
jgi:hypothetical protein